MHKSFPPTENQTRLVSHCELKAALVLFPVTKQETWSLACDWKCTEQTLPVPATSDQTQSGAHALTVQTPCVKVALYARGLRAQDVTRLRQSLFPWGNPKSRGSYFSVLSARQTIISWVGFSSQFDSASRPQNLSAHQSDLPGFHSTRTTTAVLESGEEKISPTWCTAVSALSTCTAHAWSL